VNTNSISLCIYVFYKNFSKFSAPLRLTQTHTVPQTTVSPRRPHRFSSWYRGVCYYMVQVYRWIYFVRAKAQLAPASASLCDNCTSCFNRQGFWYNVPRVTSDLLPNVKRLDPRFWYVTSKLRHIKLSKILSSAAAQTVSLFLASSLLSKLDVHTLNRAIAWIRCSADIARLYHFDAQNGHHIYASNRFS